MTDDDTTTAAEGGAPASAGGDAPTAAAGTTRLLDRAPGERYRRPPDLPEAPEPTAGAAGSRMRAIAAAVVTAAAGAAGFAVIGSFDLGLGLLAVSAFIGWAVAIALVWGAAASWPRGRSRAALAAALGGGSIVAGLALLWAWSRVEGGVLGPLDYLDQRFGLLPAADVAIAAASAALRGR
jgi:hypothetical protein